MTNSIWTNDVTMPRFPSLDHDVKTDVLIIGGGLAGVLCSHALAQNGVEHILIEADRICHGVSRNTTAKITSQHGLIYDKLMREFDADTARLYWKVNEAALGRFRVLAETVDCDFETKDNYIYARTSRPRLETELTALARLQIPAELVDDCPLPFRVAGAIRFADQAQFHPLKFVAGIAKGLPIYERTTARSFEGNTVITDRGKIVADKIVVATHFPLLNKHGAYFLKMYQQRSYVLALKQATNVDGMYLDEAENGLSFRSCGEYLLLGGGGHRTGKQGGGWAELENFAQTHYPHARPIYRWATQDCMTLDKIPYIGPYSKRTPSLYVATGFNKWGMTSSMVAAMALSDLVQDKPNAYASVFSPSRTIWRSQLACNAWETTVNLLTPTKPRCPHLGCALTWNAQERSWDCSCHGSRFDETGALLDNPATDDLKW